MEKKEKQTNAPDSVNELLRTQPRTKGFTHPLFWTSRHLNLLGCVFHPDQKIAETNLKPPQPLEKPVNWVKVVEKYNDIKWLLKTPAHRIPEGETEAPLCIKCNERWGAILNLLDSPAPGLNSYRVGLPFYASFRHVWDLPCYVFAREFGSYQNDPVYMPYLACIFESDIQHDRQHSKFTPPEVQLMRKAKMPMKSTRHTPYLVGVLIAMAQSQRERNERAALLGKEDLLTSYTASVLVGTSWDTTNAIIYTANISPDFLDRFDYPSASPQDKTPLVIRRIKIPYQPHLNFRERVSFVATQQMRLCEENEDDEDSSEEVVSTMDRVAYERLARQQEKAKKRKRPSKDEDGDDGGSVARKQRRWWFW